MDEFLKYFRSLPQALDQKEQEFLFYEYAKTKNANTIVRGLRTTNDFVNEYRLFTYNYGLSNKTIDTVFLCAELENMYTSSSTVKEVASFNGDTSPYVPKLVDDAIKEKIAKK